MKKIIYTIIIAVIIYFGLWYVAWVFGNDVTMSGIKEIAFIRIDLIMRNFINCWIKIFSIICS